MADATAGMPSSAWPRPAPSMAWLSGIIWAAASASPASCSFHRCRNSSAAAVSLPDAAMPGVLPLLPLYVLAYCYVLILSNDGLKLGHLVGEVLGVGRDAGIAINHT